MLARRAVATAAVLSLACGPALAQQLNKRKVADPSTNASTARLVTRAELQSEKTDNTSLKRDDAKDLIVSEKCAPVQIGGQQIDQQAAKKTTLKGSNLAVSQQNNTVVTGDVVNVCKQY